jgi:hypothetical protein
VKRPAAFAAASPMRSSEPVRRTRNKATRSGLLESHSLQCRPTPVSYDDLIELARLCLRQAAATSNPAAATELRRMASEYQARATALDEARMPDAAALPQSSPQVTQPQQQQQPQPEGQGESDVSSD